MKTIKFSDRETWLAFRRGKLSGSKVKDILVKRGTEEKQGFYRLIAERLAVNGEANDPRERGITLEAEAMSRLSEATKKKFNTELIVWQDEKIPNIMFSPDGFVEGKKITEAAEIKCLGASKDGENNGNHVEALIKQAVPKEYEEQVKWAFVVNPDLKILYMGFYDPRMAVHDFFYLTIKRSDYPKDELEGLKSDMVAKLKAIDEWVEKLTKGTKLAF